LLFSGLFPRRAEKKSVRISYFVDLGRSAYQQLSSLSRHQTAKIYQNLAGGFVSLMDVLHAMRALDTSQEPLSPLQAFELWADTGSPYAHAAVTQSSTSIPVLSGDKKILN
jgi:hypothetical protein